MVAAQQRCFMDDHRAARVAEAIREELSEIIGFEMHDPRLNGAVVRDVELDPGSRHVRVRVSTEGGPAVQRKALDALEHARPFLRHQLATRLNLRKVPELHFQIDRWAAADSRVDILLKRAKKKRGAIENQDQS
jgi:ribosome-binding factor A